MKRSQARIFMDQPWKGAWQSESAPGRSWRMSGYREHPKLGTNASPESGHLDVSSKLRREVKALTEIPKDVHQNKH